MRRISTPVAMLSFLFLVQVLGAQVPEAVSAELKPETLEGFARYVRATEARIDKEIGRPGAFLYVEGLPAPRRAQVLAALGRGEIFTESLKTLDASGGEIGAPGGLIHHWLGAVFIPGASLSQVRGVVQDYDHHQDVYKPEVLSSRLIRRNGNDFTIFLRLRKHKVITVTFNTEHEVHYTPVDSTHFHSHSYSTRIAEVENAGGPGEREKPVGHDGGFLWRLDSWWRFEEREGGVYVECESVSLTRDIPAGLGWLIKPFITAIPKESLQNTLASTRAAVLARAARGTAKLFSNSPPRAATPSGSVGAGLVPALLHLTLQARLIIAFGGGQVYVIGRAAGRKWKFRLKRYVFQCALTCCPSCGV